MTHEKVYSVNHDASGKMLVREWKFVTSIPENTLDGLIPDPSEILVYENFATGAKRFLRPRDFGTTEIGITAVDAIDKYIRHLKYKMTMFQEMYDEAVELKKQTGKTNEQ